MSSDNHGRQIRKLRLSLLNECSFNCLYCKGLTAPLTNKQNNYIHYKNCNYHNTSNLYDKITPKNTLLSIDKIYTICNFFIKHGIEEIRLTGGEPLLYTKFQQIVADLSNLDLKKLSLTTNGYLLNKHLSFLKTTCCNNINISLDSLNTKTYYNITGKNVFHSVFHNIKQAIQMGFNVKINCVVLKDINDHEIADFAQFALTENAEIRFLELMPIGIDKAFFQKHFVSANEIINHLKQKYTLVNQPRQNGETAQKIFIHNKDNNKCEYERKNGNDHGNSQSQSYEQFDKIEQRAATIGRIGIIAPVTHPFCKDCSRIRLTTQGMVKSCLRSDSSYYQINDYQQDQWPELLQNIINSKPYINNLWPKGPLNHIGG